MFVVASGIGSSVTTLFKSVSVTTSVLAVASGFSASTDSLEVSGVTGFSASLGFSVVSVILVSTGFCVVSGFTSDSTFDFWGESSVTCGLESSLSFTVVVCFTSGVYWFFSESLLKNIPYTKYMLANSARMMMIITIIIGNPDLRFEGFPKRTGRPLCIQSSP